MNHRLTKKCLYLVFTLFLAANTYAQSGIPAQEIEKITLAMPEKPAAKPQKPRKLLVFSLSKGFQHSSIPYSVATLKIMGQKTGAFTVEQTEDTTIFTSKKLFSFDAICFANTTQLSFADVKARENLLRYVKSGKGFIGIHAASDNFYTWPEAVAMIGGRFDGHPWIDKGVWAIKIDDPTHPLNAAFAGKDFKLNEEIYRFRSFTGRERVRVLLSLDLTDEVTRLAPGIRPTDVDIPISWLREYGKGRVFYSSLGHNHHVYWNPAILKHYLDGIQYALGDFQVDATPSLEHLLTQVSRHEFNQSRASLTALENYLRAISDSAAAKSRLEKRFIQFLQSNATIAGKDFICQALSTIGTEAAVPTLVQLLADSATAEIARFALERIPGESVDRALIQVLPQKPKKGKIGIIHTLGQRRHLPAVSMLAPLLQESDAEIAAITIQALGNIASPEALAALQHAKAQIRPGLTPLLLDAMLNCADALVSSGQARAAMPIYQQLSTPEQPTPIRIAAFRSLVLKTSDDAGQRVIAALKGEDRLLKSTAIGLVGELESPDIVRKIASELSQMNETEQAQMIPALAHHRDPLVKQVVENAVRHANVDVRKAAVTALADLGDAETIAVLVPVAAKGAGTERLLARASLDRLRGPDIDARLSASIPSASPEIKIELIRSLGQRQAGTATDLILHSARDAHPGVRLESIKALKNMAAPGHFSQVIDLLVQTKSPAEHQELVKVAAAIARQETQKQSLAQVVSDRLAGVSHPDTRSTMLTVLGEIGAPDALPTLTQALSDRIPELRIAAIRALTSWPEATPAEALYQFASGSKNNRERTLALRGFIRLAGLATDRPIAERLAFYQKAFALASDPEEKKVALAGLAELKRWPALEMAATYLSDASTRAEAEVAVIKIAAGLDPSGSQKFLPILQNIQATSENQATQKQAQELLEQFTRVADYITAWQYAGPFAPKEQNIFDYAFAPEQSDANLVPWQDLAFKPNPAIPGYLNFKSLSGDDNQVIYLRTGVWSDGSQNLNLELGSDDGIKVWLNGQLCHSNDKIRALEPAQDTVPVTLNPGWNPLKLKIVQYRGEWGACARFRTPAGKPATGLKIELLD